MKKLLFIISATILLASCNGCSKSGKRNQLKENEDYSLETTGNVTGSRQWKARDLNAVNTFYVIVDDPEGLYSVGEVVQVGQFYSAPLPDYMEHPNCYWLIDPHDGAQYPNDTLIQTLYNDTLYVSDIRTVRLLQTIPH